MPACRQQALLFAALTLLAGAAGPAHAGCQSELRILAEDLQGVALSDSQNQAIASAILQARRHCWVQHEQAAMDLINRARLTAGLKPATGGFDWENVPLESLEPPSAQPPAALPPAPRPRDAK